MKSETREADENNEKKEEKTTKINANTIYKLLYVPLSTYRKIGQAETSIAVAQFIYFVCFIMLEVGVVKQINEVFSSGVFIDCFYIKWI